MNIMFNNIIDKFFVIEGIDGSGKSTLIKQLEQSFKANGFRVHVVKFPSNYLQIPADTESFAKDRHDELIRLIRDLKQETRQKTILFTDRWIFSGIVYDCIRRNYNTITKVTIPQSDKDLPKPDRIYFCRKDPNLALKDIQKRNYLTEYENKQNLIDAASLFEQVMTQIAPNYCKDIIYHSHI